MRCPACGERKKSPDALRIHASKAHGLSAQQLYDTLCPARGGLCECGEQTKFVSFQRGYRLRCASCAKKVAVHRAARTRRANYRPAWNRGLTKDDDPSVAKISAAVSRNIRQRGAHWNTGTSKETHEHVARGARRRSATMRASYASGDRTPWNTGLTVETDDRLKGLGASVSKAMETRHVSRSDAADEWRRRISDARLRCLRERAAKIIDEGGLAAQFVVDAAAYTASTDEAEAECRTCGCNPRLTWSELLGGVQCRVCRPREKGDGGWSRGLTRDCDERLARVGDAVSRALEVGHISRSGTPESVRQWRQNISAARRISPDEVLRRLERRSGEFKWDPGVHEHVTSIVQKFDVTCITCGTRQEKDVRLLDRGSLCRKCFPAYAVSRWQLEVDEFIRSCGVQTSVNDRSVISPRELDVYIPSKKFAVECHGLYWHSEARDADPSSPTQKWRSCSAAGVSLMQLYEDEWLHSRPLVEAMLRHRLGMSKRVYARRCSVCELAVGEARGFLEVNHIDGYTPSSRKFGLFHQGELVGVATTRTPRHRKWRGLGLVEVSRMAFPRGVQVVGGASKLLKACRTGGPLMAYVDTRLGGEGAAYGSSGMTCVGDTGPRFWWTNFEERFDRFSVRADRTRGMSQAEVAAERAVVRIWGPPNLLYIDDAVARGCT